MKIRRKRAPREPMIMIVCGETGVGKTYRNLQEIKRYLKGDRKSGQKGRKVLCFDVNGHDYPYDPVVPQNVGRLRKAAARRILPFNSEGRGMTNAEKLQTVEQLLDNYRNGLLVLDDTDKYMTGTRGQGIIGALCTNRHKGLDLLLTHQSISKISTTEWQNCTWVRLHHQVDDVTRYRERITNYPLIRIAQFILDDNYQQTVRLYRQGKLSENEFKKRKSFCLYINMREQRIEGVERAVFIRAAKRYFEQEGQRRIRLLMQETGPGGKARFSDRRAALVQLIEESLDWIA